MTELQLRSLSGALYVALILLACAGPWALGPLALALVLAPLALAEWLAFEWPQKILRLPGFWLLSLLSLLLMGQLALAVHPTGMPPFLAWLGGQKLLASFSALLLASALLLLAVRPRWTPLKIQHFAFGLIYIALPLGLLYPLSLKAPQFLLALFLLIWTNDSFAYLVGRRLGKHKLAPSISPGKSWEGWLGGLAFSLGLSFLIDAQSAHDFHPLFWPAMAFLVASVGTLGDLFQSRFKRHYGLKDSGKILPGHGGILDRIDSLLFVAPISYLVLDLYLSLH